MAERTPGWFSRRLGSRASREYARLRDRDVRAQSLAEEGRYAEAAEVLRTLVGDYAKQTSIAGHTRRSLLAWIRRCDALIRAGRRTQADTEAGALRKMLAQYEGPDGELAGLLRETMVAAVAAATSQGRWPRAITS
jgi:hypothetical protein